MPQATASASAFRRKTASADIAPGAWSGRLDPDGLARPGGPLIAALQQYANERELSLSELASAMGVSYWALSQLRIGWRPISALEPELATACAELLDLPPLTVQMLARLLDPAEALAHPELSAEDLLHLRQLLSVEPAELQLLPPPNRARPLQSLSVDELAGLHREHGEHASVCRWLHEELRQRPRSKTELLRAALEASLAEQPAARPEPEAHKPAAVVVRCGCCQTRLRIRHHGAPVELVCPSCQSEYAVSWQDSVCVIQTLAAPVDEEGDAGPDDEHLHAAPEHVTDPWAVLGLQPGTAWAEVERARRALLQQYHPDRLGHVPPLVRQLAEGAFKRVGDAFETLKARR